MNGTRLGAAASLVLAALLLPFAPAKAQTPSGAVDVSVAGSDRDVTAITDALREPLQRLGITITTTSSDARAHVRIDAAPDDHIAVEVSSDARKGMPVRRTVQRGEPEPIVVEQVAYVVRTTLESMLGLRDERRSALDTPPETWADRAPASAPDDTTPRQPASPVGDTPRGGRVRVSLAPFVTERALSSTTLVTGAGLSVGATVFDDRPLRPTLWLGVSLHSSFDAGATNAMVAGVRTWSLRVVPTLGLLRLGPFWVDAGVGGGADFFDADVAMLSESRPDGTFAARLSRPGSFIDPVLASEVVLSYRVSPRASLTLGATADYALAPHRYVMSARPGGETRVLFEPWQMRPGFFAGMRVSLD